MVHESPIAPPPPPPPPFRLGAGRLARMAVITACGPFSLQMLLPALPAMGGDLGATPGEAQLVVSLAFASFGLAMLVWGPLADRVGRRGPMVAGAVLFLLGNLLAAFAPSLALVIAGRTIATVGGAAGMVLTRAMVRDLAPPERVASSIAHLTMAQVVPPLMAPLLGGLIAEAVGWRGVFVALGVAGAAVVACALSLPETLSAETRCAHARAAGAGRLAWVRRAAGLLGRRRFLACVAIGAAGMSVHFAFMAGAPLAADAALGLSPARYGAIFTSVLAVYLGFNLVAARLAPRLGIERMLWLGGGITIAGTLAGLALAMAGVDAGIAGIAALFLPALLAAAGNGLALSSSQAGAMAVEPAAAGAAAGLAGCLQMLVGAAASQMSGALFDGSALPTMAVMTLCGLGLAVGLGLLGRPPPPRRH